MTYLYDILDAKTEKTLFSGLTSREVHDEIGIPTNRAATYASAGFIYHKKYKIARSDGCRTMEEIMKDWAETAEYMRRFPKQTSKIPIVPKEEG